MFERRIRMKLLFKTVGIEQLHELVDLRIEFIKDIHPEFDIKLIDKIREATIFYFKELLDCNSYIGFFGLDENNEIVCTAGLLLYFLPPFNFESCRKIGHVLNFYTRPQYRKKGYGLELMEYIKETAKNEGINRLVLNATKIGYGLYTKAGFTEPEERAMSLDLNAQ